MRARYGDAVRVNAANGRGVAVSDPELVKQVWAADPDTFETVPVLAQIFGPEAVIATAGTTHRRQRKLLNPRFHGARVRAFLEVMQRVTHQHLQAFERARLSGGIVVMNTLGQALTLDIILETIFGETVGMNREHGRTTLLTLLHSLTPALFATPALRKSFFPPWNRLVRARENFDRWIDEMVAQRRSAASPGGDILGLLVEARYDDGTAMTDSEIRDHIMTLLLAGHETTAVSVAWGVHWLLREPRVLAKLRTDLDALGPAPSLEAVARLPYLDAVCSETLRIEPVVTDVARVCRKPLAIGPWTVPPGQIIFVNVCALLRDERLYPEPHRFRPERFLERKYGPGEFPPFGGGQRRCLGAAFAEAELAIVLSTIAREWELELVDREPEKAVRRNITMGPQNGVRIRVRSRRTATPPATN